MMALGNVIIYVVGVTGLMLMVPGLSGRPMTLGAAFVAGVLPFLVFDVIKIVAAAGLLPGTWKLINTPARRRNGRVDGLLPRRDHRGRSGRPRRRGAQGDRGDLQHQEAAGVRADQRQSSTAPV